DRREVSAPSEMLQGCRDSLMDAIRSGASATALPTPQPSGPSLGERWSALMAAFWGLRQPIGALALLPAGYFGPPFTSGQPNPPPPVPAEPLVARVRSVQPDSSGRVRISLEEVRNRVVSGRINDDNIQRLLMAASRDESDPGVRVESVGILK